MAVVLPVPPPGQLAGRVRELAEELVGRVEAGDRVPDLPPGADPVVSSESLDVRWWPLDALPDREPEMHTLIAFSRTRLAALAQSSASPSSRAPAE